MLALWKLSYSLTYLPIALGSARVYRSKREAELESIHPQNTAKQSNNVGLGGGYRPRPPLTKIGK